MNSSLKCPHATLVRAVRMAPCRGLCRVCRFVRLQAALYQAVPQDNGAQERPGAVKPEVTRSFWRHPHRTAAVCCTSPLQVDRSKYICITCSSRNAAARMTLLPSSHGRPGPHLTCSQQSGTQRRQRLRTPASTPAAGSLMTWKLGFHPKLQAPQPRSQMCPRLGCCHAAAAAAKRSHRPS